MVHAQLEMMTNTGNAEKKNKCRHDDALDDLEERLDALCSDVEGLKKLEDKVDLVNAFQSDQERIKELEKALTLSISVQKEELDKKRLKNSRVKDKFRLLDERNTTLEVTLEGQKRRLVALEDAWKGAEKEVDTMHTFTFPEKSRAPETFEDTARRIGLDPGKREEWTTRDYRLMYNACPKDERTGKPIVNMECTPTYKEHTPTYKTIAKAFSDVTEHRKNTATKPPPPSTTPSNIPAWLERFV